MSRFRARRFGRTDLVRASIPAIQAARPRKGRAARLHRVIGVLALLMPRITAPRPVPLADAVTAMRPPAMPAVRGAAPEQAEVETAATPEEMVAVTAAAMETVAETPVAMVEAVETEEATAQVEEGGSGACSLPE